jgi:hypothetical protein
MKKSALFLLPEQSSQVTSATDDRVDNKDMSLDYLALLEGADYRIALVYEETYSKYKRGLSQASLPCCER